MLNCFLLSLLARADEGIPCFLHAINLLASIGFVTAVADSPSNRALAHVAERHRRAGWVLGVIR